MTLRELSEDNIIEALIGAPENSLLDQCRKALLRDPHSTFTAAESPAEELRKILEVKHRVARTRGKTLIGDDDLLLRLHELGSQPVTGVFVDEGVCHYKLYLQAWTPKPVGAVIMHD
jgi:hypothetical protein